MLASGNGSNFEALADAARRDRLGGPVVALLCDQPAAFAIERARRLGIEALTPVTGRFRTKLEDESPWIAALRERDVDVVLLAGFMRRLHAPFLEAFPTRVLNIHPSLLPAFTGLDAIGQAWRHGARVTGCTVHMVDAGLDEGPIVAQRAVDVRDEDTLDSLAERIHRAEHALYPEAVHRFVTEPWARAGRRLVFGTGAGLTPRAVGML